MRIACFSRFSRLRCHLPYNLWLMLSRLVFFPAYRGNNGIRRCVPYLRNTFGFQVSFRKMVTQSGASLVHGLLSLRNWPASTTVLFFVTKSIGWRILLRSKNNLLSRAAVWLTSVPTVLTFKSLLRLQIFGYILPAYPTLILRRQEQKQRDKK